MNIDAAVSTASLIVDRLVGMAGMVMVLLLSVPALLEKSIINGLNISSTHPGFPSTAALAIARWWQKIWDRSLQFLHRLKEALSIWVSHPTGLLKCKPSTYTGLSSVLYQRRTRPAKAGITPTMRIKPSVSACATSGLNRNSTGRSAWYIWGNQPSLVCARNCRVAAMASTDTELFCSQ